MRTRAVVVAVAVLLVSGCADGSVPTAVPSTSPPASNEPTPTPSCRPAFTADTDVDSGTAAGGVLGLRGVASAGHDGYDRVTFAFGGSAQPGWRVEYVDEPRSDGSGDPVSVKGGAALLVVLKDVGTPGDTGVPEPRDRRLVPTGMTAVREVVLDTLYEGQYTAFVGLDRERPYRVFRLAGPPRVVVDVRHC
jgi:hypothetical protein